MKWYIATAQLTFAKYGFIGCPLTDAQLTALYKLNVKLDDAYGVGCDVRCGHTFNQALEHIRHETYTQKH